MATLPAAGAHADFVVGDEVALEVGAGATQSVPTGAWMDDSFLLVWQEDRADRRLVAASRVDERGRSLSAEPVVLSDTAADRAVPYLVLPSVACHPDECLVAWQEQGDDGAWQIRARLVDASGAPGPIVLERPGWTPLAAPAAEGFVVAWSGGDLGVDDAPGGTALVVDGDVAAENEVAWSRGIELYSIAGNGDSFALVLGAQWRGDLRMGLAHVSRLDGQGAPVGDFELEGTDDVQMFAASDGASFIVLGGETAHDGVYYLLARHLSAAGDLGPAAELDLHQAGWPSALSWSPLEGGHYLVSAIEWTRAGDTVSVVAVDASAVPPVAGPTIDIADGVAPIEGWIPRDRGPLLVSGPRSTLSLYRRMDDELGAMRARLRAITSDAPGPADAGDGAVDDRDAGPDTADAGTPEYARWSCGCRLVGSAPSDRMSWRTLPLVVLVALLRPRSRRPGRHAGRACRTGSIPMYSAHR